MTLLTLHTIGHGVLFLVLAYFLSKALGFEKFPVKYIGVGFLVTIFMDGDHLFDYFIFTNWQSFNLMEFLTYDYYLVNGLTILPLHAWEWVALILVLFLTTGSKHKIFLFVALGVASQLIFDTVSHSLDPRVYFISYRYINDFSVHIFR